MDEGRPRVLSLPVEAAGRVEDVDHPTQATWCDAACLSTSDAPSRSDPRKRGRARREPNAQPSDPQFGATRPQPFPQSASPQVIGLRCPSRCPRVHPNPPAWLSLRVRTTSRDSTPLIPTPRSAIQLELRRSCCAARTRADSRQRPPGSPARRPGSGCAHDQGRGGDLVAHPKETIPWWSCPVASGSASA
jgi:hypothetical protein